METKLKQLLKTIKLNESMLSMLFGIVTVILIGVLVFRMYKVAKPEITTEADNTEVATEKVGEVEVEVKEDGKKYPAELPETVKVAPGDHLWKIAEQYYGSGYNWVEIAKANELKDPSRITVGQELKLPKVAVIQPKVAEQIEGESYTVVKGDNLWNISVRAYGDGYKWSEVANFNELKTPNYIEVGQVIKLPR
ncbi:MAG: LysM peptidoglycan-binding domain-containing protein [bacterium]